MNESPGNLKSARAADSVILVIAGSWGDYIGRIGSARSQAIFGKFADLAGRQFGRRVIFSSSPAGAVILEGDPDPERFAGELLRRAGGVTFEHDGHLIAIGCEAHAVPLSGLSQELARLADAVAARSMRSVLGGSAKSESRFLADQAKGAALLAAIEHGRIMLRWPAVRLVGRDDAILYGLAEPLQMAGHKLVSIDRMYEDTLRRMGMERLFAQKIALAVLRLLRADPSLVLGIRMPASAGIENDGWRHIFAQLATDNALAARTIFEIEFSDSACSGGDVELFTRAVKALGCGVVLTGFGDWVSVSHIRTLQPDLVRIAQARSRDAELLTHLVGAVNRLAGRSVAIVDGVGSQLDAEQARKSGAPWIAGPHCGYWPTEPVLIDEAQISAGGAPS